jgi:hypothetical protein
VPGLLRGVPLGKPVALRRVLGARRAGRVGFYVAVALLALAAPSVGAAALGVAAYFALGALGALRLRAQGVGPYWSLRLLLWEVPAPLLLAALVRLAGVRSAWPLLLAALGSYLLLERGARSGLAGPEGDSPGRR